MILFLLSIAAGMKIPLQLAKKQISLSSQDRSEIDLSSSFNLIYYLDISIGNPEKSYKLLLDTSSRISWITDSGCVDCNFTSNQYSSKNSSSSLFTGDCSIIKQGNKNLTGNWYEDSIRINENLNISDFRFLSVMEQDGFNFHPTDGVLGLAFSNKKIGRYNIIDILKEKGLIEKSAFSLYLTDDLSEDQKLLDPPASIMFGGYEMNYTSEKLHYVKIQRTTGFWQSPLIDLQLDIIRDGKITGIKEGITESTEVLFNTGSSYIEVPKQEYSALIDIVTDDYWCSDGDDGDYSKHCMCDSIDDFPAFRINIDGREFEIGAEFYVQRDSGICKVLIAPSAFEDVIVLGIPFFKKYYSYFNFENGSAGFGLAIKSKPVVVVENSSGNGYALVFGVAATLLGFYYLIRNKKDYETLL